MAQFHFVEDYVNLVKHLKATYPLDEAMSRAVGGEYERVGRIETDILQSAGLKDGMVVVDLGCGSGRLASVLSKQAKVRYVGIDIVEDLLDYARTKSPPDYTYLCHRELSMPVRSEVVDFASAFSVFTHLLQAESYIYLREMHRILKPGGTVIFSFLEFEVPGHWDIFEATVAHQLKQNLPHLNAFLERGTIRIWAEKLGFRVDRFVDAREPCWDGHALGQSVVILRKPGA